MREATCAGGFGMEVRTASVAGTEEIAGRGLTSGIDIAGGIQMLWLVTVEIENQPKPALVAEWVVRFYV